MLYRLPAPVPRQARNGNAAIAPRPAAGTPARVVPIPSQPGPSQQRPQHALPPLRPVPRTAPHHAAMRPAYGHDDDTLWDVADIHGNVLATRLNRAHIRARLDAGLLEDAALAQKHGERDWRPISDALGVSGAHRIARYWYVTRKGGAVIGPVETALVERGILAGKVPVDSEVCEVGDDYWSPLEAVDTFRAAIDETLFDDEVTSLSIDARQGWSFTG